jgi:hypothetical protein
MAPSPSYDGAVIAKHRSLEIAVTVVTDMLGDGTAISCQQAQADAQRERPPTVGPYEWIIKETLVCRHWTVFYLNPLLAVFVDVTNCNAGFE